jgi:hypothetical protein
MSAPPKRTQPLFEGKRVPPRRLRPDIPVTYLMQQEVCQLSPLAAPHRSLDFPARRRHTHTSPPQPPHPCPFKCSLVACGRGGGASAGCTCMACGCFAWTLPIVPPVPADRVCRPPLPVALTRVRLAARFAACAGVDAGAPARHCPAAVHPGPLPRGARAVPHPPRSAAAVPGPGRTPQRGRARVAPLPPRLQRFPGVWVRSPVPGPPVPHVPAAAGAGGLWAQPLTGARVRAGCGVCVAVVEWGCLPACALRGNVGCACVSIRTCGHVWLCEGVIVVLCVSL